MKSRVLMLTIVLFILSGASFIFFVYESINTINLELGTRAISIVDSVYKEFNEGEVTIYMLKFSPNKKDTIYVENFFKTNDSRFKKGELVDIIYPINKPQEARINSSSEKYGGIFFLISFSLITLLIGIYTLKNPAKIELLFDNND